MRVACVFVLCASCTGRCGRDPPAPSAHAEIDAAADAACISAHDDALARYKKFCETERCPDESLGNGTELADLDGDGIPEIAWGWGPIPVNNESHLYRGGVPCAVHLASLGGSMMIKTRTTRHEGYLDILTEDYGICEGAGGGCTPDVDGYVFHDGEYRIDPKRHIAGTFKLGPPDED